MRLLIQSTTSGRFLCPSLEDGQPTWVSSLKEAGGGVLADMDCAVQLILDHCDFEDAHQVIDLDRLGTINDY